MFVSLRSAVSWVSHSNWILEPLAQVPLSIKPPLSSIALVKDISVDRLLDGAKHLAEFAELSIEEHGNPTRVIGSQGHYATLDYIYSTLDRLGDYYTLQNQTFDAPTDYISDFKLTIGTRPLTEAKNYGCNSTDYGSATHGSVVLIPLLIPRGGCALWEVSEQAGKAGAVAAIVYGFPEHYSGMLQYPREHQVATFSMSDADAEPYLAMLRAGQEINATVFIDSFVGSVETTNIIAQTKEGDTKNCVLVGAHSDSIAEGPGINDNGSGAIALLEVATHLAGYGATRNCVRFAWWSGEEEGLLGSDYYMEQISDEQSLRIRMAMDFDMLASPNFAYQLYNATNDIEPVGSEQLRDLFINFYEDQKQNYTLVPFDGRSDYVAFLLRDIPVGGISTGVEGNKTTQEFDMFGGKEGVWYDSCYHQPCDTLNNLNHEAWEMSTKLVAHTVATYSQSLDGFPERSRSRFGKRSAMRTGSRYGRREFI